jgi:hypothetical protein
MVMMTTTSGTQRGTGCSAFADASLHEFESNQRCLTQNGGGEASVRIPHWEWKRLQGKRERGTPCSFFVTESWLGVEEAGPFAKPGIQ